MRNKKQETMTCDSSQHLLLISTLVYDNLLSFVSFMYSHPLHLGYLLYFSPRILQILSFLFPLLLTTSIILLLLLLHCMLEINEAAAVCLLDQLAASVVVSTIGNVFVWEFEAMRELYPADQKSEHLHGNLDFDEHSSLNCEVRGDQMEVPLKNYEKSQLSESDVGIGDGMSSKSSNFDPETPSREPDRSRSIVEVNYEKNCDSQSCEVRGEDSPELCLEKSKRSEVLESHSISFVPQTPDRNYEIVANSSLVRRAKQRVLSRSESMRITGEVYKHSTLNCEVVQGPNEIFWEYCSVKTELSKSQSVRGGTPSNIRSKIEQGRAVGSMRKEKEWKRTLGCKLYEERMTFKIREEKALVEGAEEMDLLWEAYEADADDKLKNTAKKSTTGGKNEEEDEDEDEDEEVPQLCCLQALRISRGKMNLGKISKAFKGTIGFLRRSSSRSRRSA